MTREERLDERADFICRMNTLIAEARDRGFYFTATDADAIEGYKVLEYADAGYSQDEIMVS